MTDVDRGTRYTAFLSYSHKDAAVARWLHRKLEIYRIPRRLVGTEGERGPVPERLTPIFRDRDELPAAGDLSEKVRAALAASNNLLVICSPASAASPWVAKEIAAFRELHPGKPIFAAIFEGEPDQCFPKGLVQGELEPLAADLRPVRDGRRLGFLKLVAGLAGLGLDSLVQRDAQRRVRQVTWVSAIAVAAMLAMALLTVLALNARAEAQRQRAQAEGMIEFMLTDLRTKLKAVGRLDAMSAVNERAFAYYRDAAALRTLPDESLQRRARLLHARGEDDEKLGNVDDALGWFREAHAATGAILSRHPTNADAIFAHAQSEYWLGYMAYLRKDWPRTTHHWQGYKRLADRLVTLDRSDARALREAGYAEGNLCTLELSKKADPRTVLRTCQTALTAMQRLHEIMPDDQGTIRDLANRHAWVGSASGAAGDTGRALDSLRTQERLLEPLVRRTPNDAGLMDQWMRALMSIAEAADDDGQPDLAKSYNERARALARQLIQLDPRNESWRKWLRRIENRGEE